MTPREERELIVNAIIDDIMGDPLNGGNVEIIREALESHFARYRWAEIEQEYKARAGA
jgi:hypothetical protein